MTTQNAPKQVPKPFQNHQKNNPKAKPATITKKCAKVAPVGLPLGSLLAPLARLWAPLGLNWSSVWLPFAPPASSNVDFLANPRKWIQNNVKMEPKWTQNDSKIYRKMKPKLTQNIECKTNLKCPELFKKHKFVRLDLNFPWLLFC